MVLRSLSFMMNFRCNFSFLLILLRCNFSFLLILLRSHCIFSVAFVLLFLVLHYFLLLAVFLLVFLINTFRFTFGFKNISHELLVLCLGGILILVLLALLAPLRIYYHLNRTGHG